MRVNARTLARPLERPTPMADTVIQSTKRQYTDARSQPGRGTPQAQPLSKVNEELNSVTRIMTTNIQDLLGRGERLDRTGSALGDSADQFGLTW